MMIRPIQAILKDIDDSEKRTVELKAELKAAQKQCPHPNHFCVVGYYESHDHECRDSYEYSNFDATCGLCGAKTYSKAFNHKRAEYSENVFEEGWQHLVEHEKVSGYYFARNLKRN
jgi:hypothetical protein